MPYTVVRPTKSVGLGIILAFFLGPIGLLYSSISGGLLMTFFPIAGFCYVAIMPHTQLSTFIVGMVVVWILFGWLICILWAVIGVTTYNRRLIRLASISENEDSIVSTSYDGSLSKNNKGTKSLIAVVIISITAWFVYKANNASQIVAKNAISHPIWTNQTTIGLHSSPNTKSKIIGYISPGASLTALKQTNYFINVEIINTKGQLRKGFLQKSKLKKVLVQN